MEHLSKCSADLFTAGGERAEKGRIREYGTHPDCVNIKGKATLLVYIPVGSYNKKHII